MVVLLYEIKFKVWIEKDGKHVLGRGGAEILSAIKSEGSIMSASKKLGMSYRYVWDYIEKMERNLGEKVVIRDRGGSRGGGTVLTERGEELLELFNKIDSAISEVVDELSKED
ncbi:N-terminal domain of molybdenum-binding protein [Archaeoglobus sulfaticallidus PM70-1]|uniref:N-terminal domain of molybdenum-binding protein n=1 Tax=Archaeoglobus sulfaticallidus PM70-1 TaxID=387631 RepID=N0BLI7_9EURY|nr:winged helix-turn-helix domain-containing protein [Archaeoglobus sulfaticallidus]AGK61060.1 N-terminal domain of molybdenum-binding protein [Archaeoglobus sulfaticallidus PM70-1]